MRGWVYLVRNKALLGLLKIGFSTKDPILRAKEFNGTGIPFDFEVVYDALVESPRDVEQQVHKSLEECREGKEWFKCEINEAIRQIRVASKKTYHEHFHNTNELDSPIAPSIETITELSQPAYDKNEADERIKVFKKEVTENNTDCHVYSVTLKKCIDEGFLQSTKLISIDDAAFKLEVARKVMAVLFEFSQTKYKFSRYNFLKVSEKYKLLIDTIGELEFETISHLIDYSKAVNCSFKEVIFTSENKYIFSNFYLCQLIKLFFYGHMIANRTIKKSCINQVMTFIQSATDSDIRYSAYR